MVGFAAPQGYSNPPPPGSQLASGYGGAPFSEPSGAVSLLELGGMQNTFGAIGPRMGTDTVVDEDIATTTAGQTLSYGAFIAPAINGEYCIVVGNARVNVLMWHGLGAGRVYTTMPAIIVEEASICFSVAGLTCDSLDFNQDGLFPDTQDIADFLSVFGGGDCDPPNPPQCNTDIDFNNDGLFPDTQDITALLSVFAGGPCL